MKSAWTDTWVVLMLKNTSSLELNMHTYVKSYIIQFLFIQCSPSEVTQTKEITREITTLQFISSSTAWRVSVYRLFENAIIRNDFQFDDQILNESKKLEIYAGRTYF